MGALGPVRGAFRTVTVACVPAAADFDEGAWARAEEVVDEALAQRTPGVRRQVILFFRVLGVLCRARFGRGLERAGPERVGRLLAAVERSPVLLLRRGTWGVRTLAFMGVYTQTDVRRRIGYEAALRGWEARGGEQEGWPDRRGAAPPEAGTLTVANAGTAAGDHAPGAQPPSDPRPYAPSPEAPHA